LDATADLAAVPVTWSANDTSFLSGDLDQPGEMHLYRFTTAEPARLSLMARAQQANPLAGRVKLLAVTNPQSDAHVVAADQLSIAHAAAVDGWIAPGEYLIAVTADGVVADGAAVDEAVDAALGKYDLALQLNEQPATTGWQYSDSATVTYRADSAGTPQSAVVPFAPSAASDSFFGDSAPAVSVLVNSPTGSFVLNRSSETPPAQNGGQVGGFGGSTNAPGTPPGSPSTPAQAPSSPSLSSSTTSSAQIAAASALSRSFGNFPAAAAPVSRSNGAGAAASFSALPRADATASVGPSTAPSGISRSADGSDSSREGELEFAYRKASDVLSNAIGGTLRDVRDAALVGLSEAIQFDLVPDDPQEDWFADALDALLPAVPGAAVLDAALERLDAQPAIPVSKPNETPPADMPSDIPADASTEHLPAADTSPATAALAALVVARPAGRRVGRRAIANAVCVRRAGA
jgi:hypothetical protein